MASEKKITMREYNGTDYDTLYPKTIAEQVEGIYSKEDVLSDGTKTLFGLDTNAVPDDVFRLLATLNKYMYEVTVTLENGTPVENTIVGGLFNFYGESVIRTNQNGVAFGFGENEVRFHVSSPYADYLDGSLTLTGVKNQIVKGNIVLTKRTGNIQLTGSGEIELSPSVKTYDICAVGGGGGGGTNWVIGTGGGGGGGGYVTNLLNINAASIGRKLKLQIGAGGSVAPHTANSIGGDGGTTSVLSILTGQILVSAEGGKGGKTGYLDNKTPVQGYGGAGNGSGGTGGPQYGSGSSGTSGTVYLFNESSNGIAGGGGGGGGGYTAGGSGGYPNGGTGATANSSTSASSGNIAGGGGGGGCASSGSSQTGGNGANGAYGLVTIRCHY